MTRENALEELKIRLSDEHVLRRSMAVEAIMVELAGRYNSDPNIWGLTGLLHDIDYDKTKNNISLHGLIGADILDNLNVDEAIVYSVKAHNDLNGIPRKRKMDKALYLADGVVEAILRYQEDSGTDLTPEEDEQIIHKVKEDAFQVDGKWPEICKELDLSLEEFIQISLKAIRAS